MFIIINYVISLLQETVFWVVVAILILAVLIAAFACGVFVGFVVSKKWKAAGLSNLQDCLVKHFNAESEIFICSKSKPSCFHLQRQCGAFENLKPLKMCDACYQRMKKCI